MNARVPLDVAVDALAQRMARSALRRYVDGLETTAGAYDSNKIPPDEPPRVMHFWRGFGPALDVLTITAHDPDLWTSIFILEEFSDPGAWAVYGARIVGWPPEDFPLRYSLPSDVDSICDTLVAVTDAQLRTRVDSVLSQRPEYEGNHEPWLYNQVAGQLSEMKAFYEAAKANDEIVLYVMG